jgi:DNA-binding response OmpR family regulator
MSIETSATRNGAPQNGQDLSAALASLPVRPKVMLVDDEKLNSFVIAEFLKADGYRDLVYTTDPCEAVSLAHQMRPDLVLLDLKMPDLSGLDILRQLRADDAFAHTAIVILTASDDEHVRSRAIDLGAADFIHKGIERAALLARLNEVAAAADLNQGR